MAFTIEKPVKDFINKFQKDLNTLQTQMKREGDDLVKKVKKAASKTNVEAKRRELERLVEAQMRRFEPKFNSFMKDINANAKKAGIDLSDFEASLRKNYKDARAKLSVKKKKTAQKKKTSKKAATTKKTTAKAPAKKSTAKKKSTTKKSSASE